MSFFADKQKDEVTRQWAAKLRDTLKRRGQLLKAAELSHWSEEFSRMRRKFGEVEVQRVLDWFCEQVEADLAPIHSARTFMLYFDQVRGLMREDCEEDAVDDRSRRLARELVDNFVYPVEIQVRMPFLVQETRNNWESFCKRLEEKQAKSLSRRLNFLKLVLNSRAPSFVSDWFVMIAATYGHFEHYTGPTSRLVFRSDSLKFRDSFWRLWASEWTGKPDTFDELLKELVKGI